MKLFLSSLIICIAAILYYIDIKLASPLSSYLRRTTPSSLRNQNYTQPSAFFNNLNFIPPSFFANRKASNMTTPRKVKQAFLAIEQSEGVGARVRRSIGTAKLRNFSPFLMLDHFIITPGAGFPDHPHRGQETITYLTKGAVDHEDFAGNKGTIYAGDLQFMTAGRGIMHAEMPNQGFSDIAGMQLWVDLPQRLKQCEPRYRDLKASEIPTIKVDNDNVTIKIISGKSHDVDSVQELAYTPVWIFDITIKPGGKVTQDLPLGWNAFAYTLEGEMNFGVGENKTTVRKYHNVVFDREGDSVTVEVDKDAKEAAQFCMSFP